MSPMMKGDKNMLKVLEVAERLDVLPSTIRIWCRGGRFPNAIHEETLRGPVWLIPKSDLKGFEKRERGRPPKITNAAKSVTGKKNANNGPSSKKKGRKK